MYLFSWQQRNVQLVGDFVNDSSNCSCPILVGSGGNCDHVVFKARLCFDQIVTGHLTIKNYD